MTPEHSTAQKNINDFKKALGIDTLNKKLHHTQNISEIQTYKASIDEGFVIYPLIPTTC